MSRVVELRRAVHARPELGFTEIETAAMVVRTLSPVADSVTYGRDVCRLPDPAGLPSTEELMRARDRALEHGVSPELVDALADGHTGVVVTVKGTRPGPVTAFRFDMDALPLHESRSDTHRPALEGFASVHDGAMHACGHDGHVAIGVELALRLAESRDFAGEVRLVFQPAEEGVRGAHTMIAAGVADGVDRVLGLHLGLGLPFGTVAASADGVMATEKWRVIFTGQSAHAALAPEQGRHAVLGAATATLGLHGLVQMAGTVTRLNVGALHGGSSANIIPDRAELLAELRADRAGPFGQLRDRARAVIAGAAQTHGLEWAIEVTGRASTAHADAVEIEAMLQAARSVPDIHVALPSATMSASDDVTLFMEHVQHTGGTATLVLVGAGSPAPHHHPDFDLDERCLPLAVQWLEGSVRQIEDRPSAG